MTNDCEHLSEDQWSDGDFRRCGACGELLAYYAEDVDDWVEVQDA